MSPSRRTSGDINILAMLDGRAAGRRLRARPGLLRYGAGGMLACALLAVLAWLVRGAAPAGDTVPAVVAVVTPAAAAAAARTAPPAQPEKETAFSPGPTPVPATSSAPDAHGAVVVDLAQAKPATPWVLDPAAASAPRSGPATDVSDVSDVQAAPQAVPDTSGLAGTSTIAAPGTPDGAATPPAPVASSAVVAVPQRTAPARRLAPRRTLPRPAPSAATLRLASQAPAPVHADVRPPRHKRGPTAARSPASASANVDTDVAVISAILQHTGTDGGIDAAAAATATCAERSCGPRMPSR